MQASYLHHRLRDANVPQNLIDHAEEVIQLAFDAGVKAGQSAGAKLSRKSGVDKLEPVRKKARAFAHEFVSNWRKTHSNAPTRSNCVIKIKQSVVDFAKETLGREFQFKGDPTKTIHEWLSDDPSTADLFTKRERKK